MAFFPTALDSTGLTPRVGSWGLIHFVSRGDARGELVAIESMKHVPFEIKRIYYLTQTKDGVRRGFHAHQKLDQILIAINGSCCVLVDDGFRKEEFFLDTCTQGLRITNLVWREMYDFSPGAVLLVVASDFYNEEDYIRNYDEFFSLVSKK